MTDAELIARLRMEGERDEWARGGNVGGVVVMEAPEQIFASRDPDDGWRWPRASKFPEQGSRENVRYVRADLAQAPDAEDVRAGAGMADLSLPTVLKQTREDALREAAEVISRGDEIFTPDYPEWFVNRYKSLLALIPEAKT